MILIWFWYDFDMILIWFWYDFDMILIWVGYGETYDFDMIFLWFWSASEKRYDFLMVLERFASRDMGTFEFPGP